MPYFRSYYNIVEILEWYQPAIGALLWITNVRLDISFAVSTMAQFASNPTPAHVSVVKELRITLFATAIVTIQNCTGMWIVTGVVVSRHFVLQQVISSSKMGV